MVHERLEGLDAATRRVLRAASVFGEVFWVGGVDALLGGTQPAHGWAEDLISREILVTRTGSRFPGERELAFRHALLREGAYAMLTEGDRVLGHALAGRWLEAHGEADAMVLAQHFEAARDEARAAIHHRAAAGQALRAADVDAAIARAERAMAAASSETERVEHAALLAEAHAWRDEWGRAAEYADEVVRLAPPGSAVWIRAMSWKQTAALIRSRADDLLPAIMQLATVEGAPGTGAELCAALTTTVFVLGLGGQTAMVAAMVARIDSIVAAEGPSDPHLLGAAGLAHTWDSAWGQGDAWTALRHARATVAAAEATHDTRHLRFARTFVAMCLWQLGLHAEADAALPPEAAAAGDLPGVVAAIYRAMFIVDHGLLDEARRLGERRIALAERDPPNSALRIAEGRWILGEVAAREGDLDAAERELAAALDPLRPTLRSWQAVAARLVLVRLARGRVAEAVALDRTLQESLASGGYGLRGTLVKLAHAEALRASGEEAAAGAALREAWTDLEARAARIDDPAARRAFLEEVPEHARVAARYGEWLGGVIASRAP
jgi:tetratricopeptide (TPR) repeat protein